MIARTVAKLGLTGGFITSLGLAHKDYGRRVQNQELYRETIAKNKNLVETLEKNGLVDSPGYQTVKSYTTELEKIKNLDENSLQVDAIMRDYFGSASSISKELAHEVVQQGFQLWSLYIALPVLYQVGYLCFICFDLYIGYRVYKLLFSNNAQQPGHVPYQQTVPSVVVVNSGHPSYNHDPVVCPNCGTFIKR